MPGELPAIEAAIQAYFDLLHTCDLLIFDKIFYPTCTLYKVSRGAITVIPLEEYRTILAERKSPKSLGYQREEEVLSFATLSPDVALVRTRERVLENCFHDHLSFVRIQGKWKIVSKLYVTEPEIFGSGQFRAAAPVQG